MPSRVPGRSLRPPAARAGTKRARRPGRSPASAARARSSRRAFGSRAPAPAVARSPERLTGPRGPRPARPASASCPSSPPPPLRHLPPARRPSRSAPPRGAGLRAGSARESGSARRRPTPRAAPAVPATRAAADPGARPENSAEGAGQPWGPQALGRSRRPGARVRVWGLRGRNAGARGAGVGERLLCRETRAAQWGGMSVRGAQGAAKRGARRVWERGMSWWGCRGPGARADVGIAVRVPCREREWRARRAPRPRPPPPPPPPPQAAPWAGGRGPGAERAAAHTHLGAVGGRPPRSFTAAASGVPAGGERQASLLRPPRPPARRPPPAAWAGPGPPPRSAGRGRPPVAPPHRAPWWPLPHADRVTERSAGGSGFPLTASGLRRLRVLRIYLRPIRLMSPCRNAQAAALASVRPASPCLQPSPYLPTRAHFASFPKVLCGISGAFARLVRFSKIGAFSLSSSSNRHRLSLRDKLGSQGHGLRRQRGQNFRTLQPWFASHLA